MVNFMTDLQQAPGGMFNLVAIGMNIAMMVPLPEDVKTVEDTLNFMPTTMALFYRHGQGGSVKVTKIGERHIHLSWYTPFPHDVMYGAVYGAIKRVAPKHSNLIVRRETKGATCLYDISW